MRILYLTLKKQWFDMIESGEKPEEYREIKPYWTKRLETNGRMKEFDAVQLKNGYAKTAPTMLIKLKRITIGQGKKQWGAPAAKPVYILHLGERLAT